jgi:diketogulonate reductase-like aldo/keto reductase
LQKALQRLRLSYVDSLLIHKPHCWEGACEREPEGTWQQTWFGPFKSFLASGSARHIGICDADDSILDEMKRGGLMPHIIQNWMDPLHQDRAVRSRAKREGIQYQAYSTLGTQWQMQDSTGGNPVLTNKVLIEI